MHQEECVSTTKRVYLDDVMSQSELTTQTLKSPKFRSKSYQDFYTLGQIYKRVLNHENNALTKTFIWQNVGTLHPNILVDLHFYSGLKRHFRHFILHYPKV